MLYAIAVVLALILDQAVKYWTTVNIVVDTGEAKLLPGLIHLANVHNSGAAFGFMEGARWFFVVLCIAFVGAAIYALATDFITGKLKRWMAVAILAGAVGNCVDRVVCGYVVDMFEFDFLIFGKQFPVFNVADIYITLGVLVFCICLLSEKPKAPATGAVPAAAETEGAAAPEVQAVTEKAKKPARKPLLSFRPKTKIPDFPKHDLPEAPKMDPEDPFAEWDRSIRTPAEAEQPVEPDVKIYTQPKRSADASEAVPSGDKAEPEEPDIAPEVFNLEDILAEFKDD